MPFSSRLSFEGHIQHTHPRGFPVAGLLEKIPYTILVPLTVIMLLAPFKPMPHVLEKLIMLKEGTLSRPIDIVDLIYHLAPLVLLVVKVRMQKGNNETD
jgi:hypothetical protein